MRDLVDALGPHLEADPRPHPAPGDRLAAVLALVVAAPEPSLLLTERAADLSRHPGEVSLPGGLQDPEDGSLLATALREAHEELGLDPTLPVVLGALPPIHTFVSGILVTPFVATVPTLPSLSVHAAEIARVLTTPLRTLGAVERERELAREGGRVWRGWSYDVEGAIVWGATGAMVHALLELCRKEAPWLMT